MLSLGFISDLPLAQTQGKNIKTSQFLTRTMFFHNFNLHLLLSGNITVWSMFQLYQKWPLSLMTLVIHSFTTKWHPRIQVVLTSVIMFRSGIVFTSLVWWTCLRRFWHFCLIIYCWKTKNVYVTAQKINKVSIG